MRTVKKNYDKKRLQTLHTQTEFVDTGTQLTIYKTNKVFIKKKLCYIFSLLIPFSILCVAQIHFNSLVVTNP